MFRKTIILLLLTLVLFSGCVPSRFAGSAVRGASALQPVKPSIEKFQPAAAQPEPELAPGTEEKAEAPASSTAEAPAVTPTDAAPRTSDTKSGEVTPIEPDPTDSAQISPVGPDIFPEGVNPLTGLPVEDLENLALSPALVSVTNFPPSARPQAGLSFSPFVFEMYVGEGMTRFLAVFHGDYPQKGEDSAISLSDDRIGPVRSGRLPYESLRQLYNGFLVMSSASSVVLPSLGGYTNFFGSDNDDINSAMIPATRLEEVARKNPKRLEQEALSGLQFDSSAPEGGQMGTGIWIPYSYLNQVIWRYDLASGAYHRYQDKADGQTFVQATDRLNSQPLTYENVVILFADHIAQRETLIDINFMYIDRKPALLFRDGKMYPIYWTTANESYEKRTGRVRPIRFIDAQGNPFPLKPGQTWVQIVQDHTRYNEAVESEVYFDLKNKAEPGSGNWAIHFYPPVAAE